MNYSKIILFSTLFNLVINSNVFSTSLNQSFSNSVNNTTVNTNYLSQNTNEQIADTNNKGDYSLAGVPNKTLQMKPLISYKRVRSHTLTPNIIFKPYDKSISSTNLHKTVLKSSAQIYNVSKLNQKELSFYSELYSDSDDDMSCECNINNKSNSRKSTGISPSSTDQEVQNNEILKR